MGVLKVLRLSSLLIFLFLFFLSSCFARGADSSLLLNDEALKALTSPSVEAVVKKTLRQGELSFSFTDTQKAQIKSFADKNGSAALSVHIVLNPKYEENESEEINLSYGFLYEDDFSSAYHLKKSRKARPEISVKKKDSLPETFSLSFSFPKDKLPSGFYVKALVPFSLESVSLSEASVGFVRNKIPLYSFSPDGGEADFSFTSIDFSSAGKIFTETSSELKIIFFPTEDNGSIERQNRLQFYLGEENFSVRRVKGNQSLSIQMASLNKPFEKIILGECRNEVYSFLLKKSTIDFSKTEEPSLIPIPADPGLILSWNKDSWRRRDYELFSWEQFPSVLFFDFADYKTQNLFLTRLAYFVEKAGYKGTLVDDDFVLNKHGYNAHDYKADDLARFFSLVERTGFKITSQEKMLRDILFANGIILRNEEGGIAPGKGAIISVSRESPDYLRYTLMAHESWHGIYFTDEDFRNTVYVSYSLFDPKSMDFLKTYWSTQPTLAYDRADEYLMRNEFMAYIMQQQVSQIKQYWVTHAKWNSVQKAEKELADYIIATDAQAFEDAAMFLASYAFDRWGLYAGRVNLVAR